MRDAAQRTNWGAIGRISVLTSLIAATVVFFALPDERWISAILVGLAVFDGIVYTLVLPRLTADRGAPALEDLDRMNAEAEAQARADDQ